MKDLVSTVKKLFNFSYLHIVIDDNQYYSESEYKILSYTSCVFIFCLMTFDEKP